MEESFYQFEILDVRCGFTARPDKVVTGVPTYVQGSDVKLHRVLIVHFSAYRKIDHPRVDIGLEVFPQCDTDGQPNNALQRIGAGRGSFRVRFGFGSHRFFSADR